MLSIPVEHNAALPADVRSVGSSDSDVKEPLLLAVKLPETLGHADDRVEEAGGTIVEEVRGVGVIEGRGVEAMAGGEHVDGIVGGKAKGEGDDNKEGKGGTTHEGGRGFWRAGKTMER